MRAPALITLFATLLSLFAVACGGEGEYASLDTGAPSAESTPDERAPEEPTEPAQALEHATPPGDPHRGRALVEQFECARCHEGTGAPAIPTKRHCVHCHQDISTGKLGAGSPDAARYRDHTAHLRDVPSLSGAGARFRREWVVRYLLAPHDLRPALTMTMPRLALTEADAADIAAYLVPDPPAGAPVDDAPLAGADLDQGRALMEANGCGTCHAFTGAPPLSASLPQSPREDRSVIALAPDLAHARDRLRPAALVAWLLDPKSVKPDAVMPRIPLTPDQARDIAAYVLRAPLASPEPKPVPERLPILSRRVTYKEVEERVFGVTCHHCHSEPRTAAGDGGPGYGGGFGFAPRRLDLSSYRGIAGGLLDDRGERHAVSERLPDGTPRLVAALMARHAEESGQADPRVHGMPLGLPPLPLEDIQLVETWIAQGRPQ